MIENNNTNDVAYLGWFKKVLTLKSIILKKKESHENKVPFTKVSKQGTTAIFDCNGCRYGFRIKQLKTK